MTRKELWLQVAKIAEAAATICDDNKDYNDVEVDVGLNRIRIRESYHDYANPQEYRVYVSDSNRGWICAINVTESSDHGIQENMEQIRSALWFHRNGFGGKDP